MSKLISDHAQYEFINSSHSILQASFIDAWQSEPHYQNQNFSELQYQTIKRLTNRIIASTISTDYT